MAFRLEFLHFAIAFAFGGAGFSLPHLANGQAILRLCPITKRDTNRNNG
jgi:hypothetical protein